MTMGLLARGFVQVLASHALVSTAAVVLVLLVWTRVAACPHATASRHARHLFLLRLFPAMASAGLAWMAVPAAFLWWEPRVLDEQVGPVALALAAAGAVLVAAAAWRGARAMQQARHIDRRLLAAARARLDGLPLPSFLVETRFPIVALVGLLAPRLFVARSVVEACTPDEFHAVVAHEQVHARARDNLRRLAMMAAPDVLAWLPASHRIARVWAEQAELAADESAGRDETRQHLAAALVKVARLASTPSGPLPASALYGGESIAERVHQLLEPPRAESPTHRAHGRTVAVAVAVSVAMAIAGSAGLWLPLLHHAMERLLEIGLR